MEPKSIEAIALAYTVKISLATSPKEFLDDYNKNLEEFKKLQENNDSRWLY